MQHTITPEEWSKHTLCFRLANIGSEVERCITWRNKRNSDYGNKAFERALELIDITIAGALTFPQYKEISRMRELLVDWYIDNNLYKSTDTLWQKYFYAFTIASRL